MQRTSRETMDLPVFQQSVAALGWAVTDPVVDTPTIAELRDCVALLARTGRGGARNLLDHPRIAALAAAPTLRQFAVAVLGDPCFAVRALFFDKTPDANWKVVWHQDSRSPRSSALRWPTTDLGPRRAVSRTYSRRSTSSSACSPFACISIRAPQTTAPFALSMARIDSVGSRRKQSTEFARSSPNPFALPPRAPCSPFVPCFYTLQVRPRVRGIDVSFTSNTLRKRSRLRSPGIGRLRDSAMCYRETHDEASDLHYVVR